MQRSSNEDSTPEIDTLSSHILSKRKPVLMANEFRMILREILPKNTRIRAVENMLEKAGVIEHTVLKSEHYSDTKRISVPSLNPSAYHYAISLRADTYLSHGSAVHLLGLTQQQPRTIYVNKEQSEKPQPEGVLTQESIDRAFSRPQRRSNYVFRIGGYSIVLISGKATGREGVTTDQVTGLPTTCLERTLIDITVRPRYAGGVFQVAEAFKTAVSEIDSSKLLIILEKLNYRYPYHQALGFYLDRAGASKEILGQLRDYGTNFAFYLDYSMANPSFDESWRVFHPLGI